MLDVYFRKLVVVIVWEMDSGGAGSEARRPLNDLSEMIQARR